MAIKKVVVTQGEYKGKTAEILGTDKEYLGHSIFHEKPFVLNHYHDRMYKNAWGVLDKVYAAKIDDKIVFLNENEIKPEKTEKKEK